MKMRWICGAQVAPIASSRFNTTVTPATSNSQLGAATAGVLRLVMHTLEAKDIKMYRPKGIKRYQKVVTSIDPVVKEIKVHQQRLAKTEV